MLNHRTTWLVQTNIVPESVTPVVLQRACESQRRPYQAISVLPGSQALPPMPEVAKGGSVVFHGRSRLILNALASPWKHGVFFDPATFRHGAYAEGFGERLLNHGAEVVTWRELLERAEGASGYRFLKPNDDFKGFTGQAIDLSAAPALYQSLIDKRGGADLLDMQVVVAAAREVDAEWRLFVVDGEIVTGSMYRPTGGSHLPADLLAFARSAIGAWTPAPVFALDIGWVDRKWKVIECNCFNASRLYDANVERLVQVVSEYQEARYGGLPDDERVGML